MSTKLVTPEGKEVNSAENLIELAERQMETCNQLEAGIIDDATAESITRTRSGFAKLMKLQLVYNISKARGLTPKMALLENKELESTNKTVQLEEQEVKKGNCVSPYLSPDENINIILTESQLKATSYAIAMAIKDYEDTYVNHTTGQYTCGGTTYIHLQARDLERVKEKLENANLKEDLQ